MVVRSASTACRHRSRTHPEGHARCYGLVVVVPLGTLERAVASAQTTLDAVLLKARFWQRWAGMPLNERQVKLLNRLLGGFEGKLTSSKWATITKCSPDTALRDITQLLELGVLKKSSGGGRSIYQGD